MKLWATTTNSAGIVKIYVAPKLSDCYAVTYWEPKKGHYIHVSQELLDCHDPYLLNDYLVHEFIHVLEGQFKKELALKPDKNCTQAAVVFGRELPRMLRNFKKV